MPPVDSRSTQEKMPRARGSSGGAVSELAKSLVSGHAPGLNLSVLQRQLYADGPSATTEYSGSASRGHGVAMFAAVRPIGAATQGVAERQPISSR